MISINIKIPKALIFIVLVGFSSFTWATNQQNIATISNCLSQGDPTSCLLIIAQQRANTIKNPDKKAEAIASVIWAYADSRKENPELFKSAWSFYNESQAKISASNKLDLYTSLIVYLAYVDKKSAERSLPDLYSLYKKIRASKKYEDQYAAVSWSCSLFDIDDDTWKILKTLFISECTNQNIAQLEPGSDPEFLMHAILKLQKNVGWSNKKYVDENFPLVWNYNQEIIKLAETKDGKLLRNELYAFLALLKIMQADSIVRFENYSAAKTTIDSANIFMGKIDSSSNDGLDKAISVKTQYIKYLYQWGRVGAAIKTIAEIQGTVEGSISKRPTSTPEEVSYIASYAHLKYLEKNLDIADKLRLEKSQSLRQADVLYTASRMYSSSKQKDINNPDNPELNLLITSAEAGHPLAMYHLGLTYSAGLNGVPIDKETAFYWYSQSALDGFAGAQNNLGSLYEKGEGVKQSYPEAAYWYTQAAMQGEPTAYLSLGEIFYKGLGVNKNNLRAAFWLTLAYRNLPNGTNKRTADSLLKSILNDLTNKEIESIYWRASMFKPLKQTENTLGDTLQKYD